MATSISHPFLRNNPANSLNSLASQARHVEQRGHIGHIASQIPSNIRLDGLSNAEQAALEEWEAVAARVDFEGSIRADEDSNTQERKSPLKHVGGCSKGPVPSTLNARRQILKPHVDNEGVASKQPNVDYPSLERYAAKFVLECDPMLDNATQMTMLKDFCQNSYPYWRPTAQQLQALWDIGRSTAFPGVQKRLLASIQQHQETEAPRNIQNALLRQAIRLRFPYAPRESQVEALWRLIYDKKDLILIARTSFGKSTVLQAYSLLLGFTTLVILPLNQIGAEQEDKIRALGGTPLALNADRRTALSDLEIDRLENARYTHLFMSPEAALAPWFQNIMQTPAFQERIGLMVIDEFHLVDQWGRAFRREYAKLKYLRSGLPARVVWFACSATLDALTLEEARLGAGFAKTTSILRTDIDRPEILLQVAAIPKGTLHKFSALFHILDPAYHLQRREATPEEVPKSVVFMESRQDCSRAADAMKAYLQESSSGLYTTTQLDAIVKVFHSKTGKRSQERILSEFRKAQNNSNVRVILATEALGLGIDLDDILAVYQYRPPRQAHLAVIWQRVGRAARKKGLQGRFVLLVEESMLKKRTSNPPPITVFEKTVWNKHLDRVRAIEGNASPGPPVQKKAKRTEKKNQAQTAPNSTPLSAQQYARVEEKRFLAGKKQQAICREVLSEFITTKNCRRLVVLRFLSELDLDKKLEANASQQPGISPIGNARCCDNCTGQHFKIPTSTSIEKNQPQVYCEKSLVPFIYRYLRQCEWEAAKRAFRYACFPATPGSLYPRNILKSLSQRLAEEPPPFYRLEEVAVYLASQQYAFHSVDHTDLWSWIRHAKASARKQLAEAHYNRRQQAFRSSQDASSTRTPVASTRLPASTSPVYELEHPRSSPSIVWSTFSSSGIFPPSSPPAPLAYPTPLQRSRMQSSFQVFQDLEIDSTSLNVTGAGTRVPLVDLSTNTQPTLGTDLLQPPLLTALSSPLPRRKRSATPELYSGYRAPSLVPLGSQEGPIYARSKEGRVRKRPRVWADTEVYYNG